jgi:hypothetical protein
MGLEVRRSQTLRETTALRVARTALPTIHHTVTPWSDGPQPTAAAAGRALERPVAVHPDGDYPAHHDIARSAVTAGLRPA